MHRLILVLRPRERVACITKLFARGFPVELPIDECASAVLPAERRQIGDSSLAEALSGEEADLDFRLVEPASVFGRVVHGEGRRGNFRSLGSRAAHRKERLREIQPVSSFAWRPSHPSK